MKKTGRITFFIGILILLILAMTLSAAEATAALTVTLEIEGKKPSYGNTYYIEKNEKVNFTCRYEGGELGKTYQLHLYYDPGRLFDIINKGQSPGLPYSRGKWLFKHKYENTGTYYPLCRLARVKPGVDEVVGETAITVIVVKKKVAKMEEEYKKEYEEKEEMKAAYRRLYNKVEELIGKCETLAEDKKQECKKDFTNIRREILKAAVEAGFEVSEITGSVIATSDGNAGITGFGTEELNKLERIEKMMEEASKRHFGEPSPKEKKPPAPPPKVGKDLCGKGYPDPIRNRGITKEEWEGYTCMNFGKPVSSNAEAEKGGVRYTCIYEPICEGKNYCCADGANVRCCKPLGEAACEVTIKNIDNLVASQPIEVEIMSQNINKLHYKVSPIKDENIIKEDIIEIGGPKTKSNFQLSLAEGNYKLEVEGDGTPCCDPEEFKVAPAEPSGEEKGMDWWKIPCLTFLKRQIPAPEWKGRKILGLTPIDAVFTTWSAIYALAFTVSLDKEGKCIAEVPLDTDACEKCEEDPYRLCTKERCEILGLNCYAVPRDDGKGYHCFKADCADMELAKINSITFKWYMGLGAEVAGSATASSNHLNVTEELPWNVTYAALAITQDKEAKCRYVIDSFEANFSEMLNFEDNENYPSAQNVSIALTELKSGDHWIFIKCRNKCGAENPAEDDSNFVRFRIAEIPEGVPPIIDYIEPESGYISSVERYVNVTLWLNENGKDGSGDDATCKYSTIVHNFTTNWSEMTPFNAAVHSDGNNSVYGGTCKNDQKCRGIENASCAHCSLNLDLEKGYITLDTEEILAQLKELGIDIGISAEELAGLLGTKKSKVYHLIFRCQDKQGNKNEPFNYILISIDPFNLTIVKPPVADPYERQPEIEVETSADNLTRATYCRYKVFEGKIPAPSANWDEMSWIDETLSPRHLGKINKSLEPNNYALYVKCHDTARIEVANWTYFEILKDLTPPKVIRLYHDKTVGDYLTLETDEPSECVYGVSSCNYNFSDGNAMTSTNKYLHTAYWSLDHLYYVKCKDKWGNQPSANECTAIISPYEVPVL